MAVRAMPGQMVSILRQELDSLVRVVFLLAQDDQAYWQQLLHDSVSGVQWRRSGSKQRVTDREMVELADRLHGWTKSVYAFGCAFIHLSSFHDHQTRDPLDQVTQAERDAIIRHLRYYHGGPTGASPRFTDVVPLLPMVFTKIADNLECYLAQVQRGESLEQWDGPTSRRRRPAAKPADAPAAKTLDRRTP